MDDLAASAIAQALGNDPLLIGLHDLRTGAPPHDVIARYVADELERTALKVSLTVTDLEDALRALGHQMLERRNLLCRPASSAVSRFPGCIFRQWSKREWMI